VRFFLDQNIDARVGQMLRAEGHQCWSADDAGLSDEDDDSLTVYAQDRRAVLVTHDEAFSKRRRRSVIGQHIWLQCSERDALDLLRGKLGAIEDLVLSGQDVFIRLSKSKLESSWAWE
jgi:predicted nuclease of predicted toxin-antitoxin system